MTRTVLSPSEWTARAHEHEARADALTAAARERRSRGRAHPVEDFLYEYYALKPRRLRRWEPGVGVALTRPGADDAAAGDWTARAGRRWMAVVENGPPAAGGAALTLDAAAFAADRSMGLAWIDGLLRRTAAREPHLGCLGLHEWAMVYRQGEHRHPLPLRLGQEGTDAVVDGAAIRCTHYDAYRFFTPSAAPLNRLRPSRENQPVLEQPACLHANMDLLKWSLKLGPAVPGDLLLDCFELARDVRVLDMEASPYDCRDLGYSVVAIETAQGRAQYIERQRAFAERAAPLRARLAQVTGALLAAASDGVHDVVPDESPDVRPDAVPAAPLHRAWAATP